METAQVQKNLLYICAVPLKGIALNSKCKSVNQIYRRHLSDNTVIFFLGIHASHLTLTT
jgi:hypothetical protein